MAGRRASRSLQRGIQIQLFCKFALRLIARSERTDRVGHVEAAAAAYRVRVELQVERARLRHEVRRRPLVAAEAATAEQAAARLVRAVVHL